MSGERFRPGLRGALALAVALACTTLAGSQTSTAAHSTDAAVPRWPAWVCKPGDSKNRCNVFLDTTVIEADGSRRVSRARALDRDVDCFYVYPTVSRQRRGNSTLAVTDAEAHVAVTQAAQFGRVCEVWAPMYRQVTVHGYGNPYNGKYELEYRDVLAAWRAYLAHYNFGRGVVLIGHSEGAYLLADLIRKEIEPSPRQRKLLVSAILLGGGVSVANGSTTGGSFKQVRACRSMTHTGCVVAYSSWGGTPPANAAFQDVDKPSSRVLCVNPAAPGSDGPAPVTPLFPGINPQGIVPAVPSPYTRLVWVAFPNLYTARCVRQGKRAWLLIDRIETRGDARPTVKAVQASNWGLHAADVNIALGTLIALVDSQARSWLTKR